MSEAGNVAPGRPRVLLVTPAAPTESGNGLAMRAALTALGLARRCELWTAVVPVSDPGVDERRMRWIGAHCARAMVVTLADPALAVRDWLASAAGRELVAAAQPLPPRARLASPALGDEIVRRSDGVAFDAIWVLRAYLAATVLPWRGRTPRPRLIVDVDEDDEAALTRIAELHLRRGEANAAAQARAEAAAMGRLAAATLPWFDRVVAATALERRALETRYGLADVAVLPNAVRLHRRSDGPPLSAGGATARILFVGNLDYFPNRDALELLVTRILPRLRAALPSARLDVAGAGGGERIAALGRHDGVRLHGFVDDLETLYRSADMTLVPLRAGGGSRVKILEAFAHGLPVVATAAAALGLDFRAGEHLLLAESDEDLAAAAIRIATDRPLAERLARRAFEFVSLHHDLDTVAGQVSPLLGLDVPNDTGAPDVRC